MPEWRSRVSQTLFWLLTIGAALAGAYKEPLLVALSHPDPDIRALARRVPADYSCANSTGEEGQGEGRLGQKEMAFLLQFAVCDLGAMLEAQDAVFGPVADWLLDSILSDHAARRAMADRFDKGHSDAHLVVWELMKMFWLVEQIRPYPLTYSMLDRQAPLSPRDVGADESDAPRGPVESAVAVFFGMFRSEETLLPTALADGSDWDWWLTARPAVPDEAHPEEEEEEKEGEGLGEGTKKLPKLPRSISIAVFFDFLFNHSGRPNHIHLDQEPVAPLEFKFFEYFLRRHLGLCLDVPAFREDEIEYMNRSYQEFTETVAIFSHDDIITNPRSWRNGHLLKDDRDEHRRSYWDWGGSMLNADFLDGFEMLTRYPSYFTHFYQPKRE
ncbi:hypothetical protein C8A05DRAFT_39109 [Staphylotrichum tortipilum]|uniref:Uncharacterized protein n=1 Tax=Staphylotrichum tortipilum TaxID=2831512 RepID=A0AAN6MAS3_9PEZI|nr:hypothetical protein C8A05DRAFT_39109 [Staphylotrichum longicolle]